MREVAILSCGAAKQAGTHPAHELYVGGLFRMNLKAAVVAFGLENVFILSAKYGLMRATDEIEAYDVKFGDAGTIAGEAVELQVAELGLDAADAYVFAPRAYWECLRAAGERIDWFPQWVNAGDAGIGYQRRTARMVAELYA